MSITDQFIRFLQERGGTLAVPHAVLEPREQPAFSAPIEGLYGVPVFDLAEGFKGQVLAVSFIPDYVDERHRVPTHGYEFVLGHSVMFARPVDTREQAPPLPVVVHGTATPFMLLMRGRRLQWYEYRVVSERRFRVAVTDILNMLEVLEGRSPVIVTDKHGVRTIRYTTDSRRLAELNNLVEELSREVQRARMAEEEWRVNASLAQNLAESYRTRMLETVETLRRMNVEYAAMLQELERHAAELRRRETELEVEGGLTQRLRASIDSLYSAVDAIERMLRRQSQLLQEMAAGLVAEASEAKEGERKEGG